MVRSVVSRRSIPLMQIAISKADAWPALFAQLRNIVRPRFWSMLAEVLRFCDLAP